MATERVTRVRHPEMPNIRIPFEQIHVPGAYVSGSGNLFRIPPDALTDDRSPALDIVSGSSTVMTLICENPWVPVSKARQLAADADLVINF